MEFMQPKMLILCQQKCDFQLQMQHLAFNRREGKRYGKYRTGITRTTFYTDYKVTVCSHGQRKLFEL